MDGIITREFEKDGETWLEVRYTKTISYKHVLDAKGRELYNTQEHTKNKIDKNCRDYVMYDMKKAVLKELDETTKVFDKLSAPLNRWTISSQITEGKPVMILNPEDVGIIVDLVAKNKEK